MASICITDPIAVVGCGRMGDWHISILRSLGFANISLCDHRREVLEMTGRRHGVSPNSQFSSVADMLRSVHPIIWIIATTADTHFELVMTASRHGAKCVLCEKPLAQSILECEHLISTCEQRGVLFAVNHQVRYMPAYALVAKVLREVDIGPIESMTVTGGNGGLAMIGSHLFEAFRWITGERIDSVQAWFSPELVPNPRGPQFQDHGGCIRAVTPSGKRLYIDLSTDQGHGLTITYCCRYGQISVEPLAGEIRYSSRKPEDRELPTTRYSTSGERHRITFDPFVMESSQKLIRDLLEGGTYPTAHDGKHAVECLVAAHVSNENGNIPIRLDNLGPHKDRRFNWA